MSHDCIRRVNELLREHNTVISQAVSFSDPSRELIQVATAKVDSLVRSKPKALFASFCPFCGLKLASESSDAV